jgi:hypothetical protein
VIEDRLIQELADREANVPSKLPRPMAEKYRDTKAIEKELSRLSSWRTFDLVLFQWTCGENCRYTCMMENVGLRQALGEDTVKYYGKWPFLRVFGTQELLSTVFSLFNLVPFFQYWFIWPRQCPEGYFLRLPWFGYALSGMNTWLWSAVFHARDNIYTERLDYFCATFSILYLLWLTILRMGQLRKPWQWCVAALPLLAYFTWHCYTLHYVFFDYGWNMTMMLVFGLTYLCSWFVWAYVNRGKFNYTHKIVYANLIILFFAAFEVFDFPPLLGLLDAHATWHFATPVASYLTWSFAVDDAVYVANQETHKWT